MEGVGKGFPGEVVGIALSLCKRPCKREVQSKLGRCRLHVDQESGVDSDLAPVRLQQSAGNESQDQEE